MTDYADLKVAPVLRDLLEDAAKQQYGQDFRAISRAGHEAVIAWLVLRADDDIVQDVLADHAYQDIQGVIDDLRDPDADGRFEGDDQFDPLAAVRTPRDLDGDGDD